MMRSAPGTTELAPQAYAKHLGDEPQRPSYPGPAILSDRCADATLERRYRQKLFKGIVATKKRPFNVTPGMCAQVQFVQYERT